MRLFFTSWLGLGSNKKSILKKEVGLGIVDDFRSNTFHEHGRRGISQRENNGKLLSEALNKLPINRFPAISMLSQSLEMFAIASFLL